MLYTVMRSSIFQSLIIRVAGLVGRLILLFLTIRYLSAESLGLFNLAQAGIGIFSLLAGLELVQFVNREIANQPDGTPPHVVARYFVMTLPLALIALMAFGAFVSLDLLSDGDVAFSYILLFLLCSVFLFEHYNNEMQRILIASKAMISANIVLLIRAGVWPVFMFGYVMIWGQLTIYSVLSFWCAASGLAALFGFWRLVSLGGFSSFEMPSLVFVKASLVLSLPLFAGMLCQRSPFFLDKYFLSESGYGAVGNYSVLLSLSLILRMLFEASLLAYFTPRLLRTDFASGPASKIYTVYGMAFLFTGALGVGLFVLRGPVLGILNKADLAEYSFSFGLLILAICLVSVSLISTLIMIARLQQRTLLACDALYFAIFLTMMLAGSGAQIDTLICAHLFAASVLVGLKLFFVIKNSNGIVAREHMT